MLSVSGFTNMKRSFSMAFCSAALASVACCASAMHAYLRSSWCEEQRGLAERSKGVIRECVVRLSTSPLLFGLNLERSPGSITILPSVSLISPVFLENCTVSFDSAGVVSNG